MTAGPTRAVAAAAPAPGRAARPSLRTERAFQRGGYPLLAGMDEVGRGALAGPVTVGVVVIDPTCRSAPQGVKDSKLLTPAHRERMVPRIRRWAMAHAVAHASAEEIDAIGIIAALRLAGTRALAMLPRLPDLVILDGNHDWLTDPGRAGLFAFAEPQDPEVAAPGPEAAVNGSALVDAAGSLGSDCQPMVREGRGELDSVVLERVDPQVGDPRLIGRPAQPRLRRERIGWPSVVVPPVTTMIKADLRCSSVAAASVLAKVERDGLMVGLAGGHPAYRWEENKGYAAPDHVAALRALGPCELHRRTWRLGGMVEQRTQQDAVEGAMPGSADR